MNWSGGARVAMSTPPRCAFFHLHTVRGVVICKHFSALYVHDTAESDYHEFVCVTVCVCVCVCSCWPRHLHIACATQACTPRFCFWFSFTHQPHQ